MIRPVGQMASPSEMWTLSCSYCVSTFWESFGTEKWHRVQSSVLLKVTWANGSPGDLGKMQILIQEVWGGAQDCLSNKLPGDSNAHDTWSPLNSKDIALGFQEDWMDSSAWMGMTLFHPGVLDSKRNLKIIKWSISLSLPLERPNKIKRRSKAGAGLELSSPGLTSSPSTLLCSAVQVCEGEGCREAGVCGNGMGWLDARSHVKGETAAPSSWCDGEWENA